MRRRRYKRDRTWGIPIVLFFILLFIILYGVYFLKSTIEPNLEEISKIRARTLVNRMVTSSINEKFKEDQIDTNELLIVEKSGDGQVKMVQSNTQAMNLLITDISKKITKRYINSKEETMKVPIGSLLGSKVLSQTGPKVNVKISPLSVTKTDFKTEFESQGINQTKYKVYIIIESQVKVLAPFSSSTFSTKTTVLIAEAVILGEVPRSYVQVPKESVIDGMQVTEE